MNKIFFDGLNRLIYFHEDVDELDIDDIYSEWKRWVLTDNNLKWASAFSCFGGQSLSNGDVLARSYVLINKWKILIFQSVILHGNLSCDGYDPFIAMQGKTSNQISIK